MFFGRPAGRSEKAACDAERSLQGRPLARMRILATDCLAHASLQEFRLLGGVEIRVARVPAS